jgi:hypothetical protein
MTPEISGGLIIKGDTAVGVGDVDRDRKRFEYLWPRDHMTLTVDQLAL